MTEIETAAKLVAVSVRQGVQMSLVEAGIMLDYIGTHGFSLVADGSFNLMLHDTEEEYKFGHTNYQPYTVREAVEFCQEMNGELLLECIGEDEPDEKRLLDLQKDELILSGLMEKVSAVIPPVVRQYNIVIVEYLKRVVPVEAASWAEAKTKVERAWKDGEYVLGADDFAGVTFNTSG